MQRYADDAAINRKARLGTILSFVGFGLLLASLVLSFRSETVSLISLGSALFGMIITQVGVTLTNRWGKRPRVDEIIDASLKGMDSRYALFHYALGSDHVLFTPSTIYALIPCFQEGRITFEEGMWWQSVERRGKERKKALKKLEAGALREVKKATRKIWRLVSDKNTSEVIPLLLFLNSKALLDIDDSPLTAVHHKKLKQHLRKSKRGGEAQSVVEELAEAMQMESST